MSNKPLAYGCLGALAIVLFGVCFIPSSSEQAEADESRSESSGDLRSKNRTGLGQKSLGLSSDDISSLGKTLRRASSASERREAFSDLLDGLTSKNAHLIQRELAHLDPESAEFKEFLFAWGAVAGEQAVWNGQDMPTPAVSPALAGWASTNPSLAGQFLESFPRNKNYEGLKFDALSYLAERDLKAAQKFVYALTESGAPESNRMMQMIAGGVLRSAEPQEAAAWADELPEGELRLFARDRVALDYVAKDPKGAAQWAEQIQDSPGRSRLINNVGRDWAYRDPEAAVAWLESLPASDGKVEGFGSALGAWALRDPEAAGNYIREMDRSRERDAALSGFAIYIKQVDPPTAIAWANSIGDPEVRTHALIESGRSYLRSDPEAAREWLAGSTLSETDREKVLAPEGN